MEPLPTATPVVTIPSQHQAPTPVPSRTQPGSAATPAPPTHTSNCVIYSHSTTLTPPANGGLAAPYGQPPSPTGLTQQLTQQLFQLINSNRVACGLPPFAWSSTLANGARLHGWNMYHCGFSHTCPDGMSQCQRIANEGFGGAPDCGECIGLAGPYPSAWGGVYNVQMSMENEPLGGWHRIHLFSTTLHRVGVGVYVAPNGWIWFVEDLAA
jgi:uncharacterized protein YkwD